VSLFDSYVCNIKPHYGNHVTVVFNGYKTKTTKAAERSSRSFFYSSQQENTLKLMITYDFFRSKRGPRAKNFTSSEIEVLVTEVAKRRHVLFGSLR
jgi:hypothetical protein